MKRIKYRVFKRRSDLIKHAVRHAIRSSVLEAEAHAKRVTEHLKENDWLAWAKRKLRMPR